MITQDRYGKAEKFGPAFVRRRTEVPMASWLSFKGWESSYK